jgi:hypothetical protein
MIKEDRKVVAWCLECEWIQYDGPAWDPEETGWDCPRCGGTMKAWQRLSNGEKAIVRVHVWLRQVKADGLGGPSPGGAANRLGCSRSMIDKLVSLGVLERAEYHEDGHHVVFISSRSIEAAREKKRKTGRWTDAKGDTDD